MLELWPIEEGLATADHLFDGLPHVDRVDIAICEDELGNMHRFGPNAAHEVWPRDAGVGPEWTLYRRFYPGSM